jgi:hypothetical protein
MTIKTHENDTKSKKTTTATNGKAEPSKQAVQTPVGLTPEVVQWIQQMTGERTDAIVRENAELRTRLNDLEAKQTSSVNAERLHRFFNNETLAAAADKAEKAKTLQDARDVSERLYDASLKGLVDCMKLEDKVPRTFHIDTYELVGVIAVGALTVAAASYMGYRTGNVHGHKKGVTEGYGHGASDMRALSELEAANDVAPAVVKTTTMRRRAG